jgi:hypothetical protein
MLGFLPFLFDIRKYLAGKCSQHYWNQAWEAGINTADHQTLSFIGKRTHTLKR